MSAYLKNYCVLCVHPTALEEIWGHFFQSLFCPSSLERSKLWVSNSGHEHFHGETLEPSRCPISSVFFGDLSSIGCLGRKGVVQVGADETVKTVKL